MSAKISYSIVIPHRNSADLLRRCLDSIEFRDDVEVIVVDDGSDEQAEEELKRIESEYRIKLIREEHVNAGHARNTGLLSASGEWIVFADADDRFVAGAFGRFDALVCDDADVVYFNVCDSRHEGRVMVLGNRSFMFNRFFKALADGRLTEQYVASKCVTPWGKIIRREFIVSHGIRFESVMFSNDLLFNAMVVCARPRMKFCHEPLYVLYDNTDGALTTHLSDEAVVTRYRVCRRTNRYYRQHGLSGCCLNLALYFNWAKKRMSAARLCLIADYLFGLVFLEGADDKENERMLRSLYDKHLNDNVVQQIS